MLTVFLLSESMATMRACKYYRLSNIVAFVEILIANLALKLTSITVIIVDIMVGRTTLWADSSTRNRLTVPSLDGVSLPCYICACNKPKETDSQLFQNE